MNANFEKFISPAIERQEIWRVIVVGAIWMALYLLLSSLYFLAAFGLGYLENLDALREGEFNTPPLMIFLLSSFLFWILALLIPMWFFHRRGLISLLGGLSRRFFVHMGLGAAGFFIFVFLLGQLDRQEITLQENIDPTLWQIYLLPGLFLLLIQVSAEELLFRGYLQQQIAARFRLAWLAIIVPSLLFGMGHFTMKLGLETGIMLVAMTTLLGLILAEVTYRTGSLGAAIGIHFANNLGGMFIVSFQDFASGLALYRAAEYYENPELLPEALRSQLIIFVSLIALYYLFQLYRSKRASE